jgi:hypothetical protein
MIACQLLDNMFNDSNEIKCKLFNYSKKAEVSSTAVLYLNCCTSLPKMVTIGTISSATMRLLCH